uniref:Anaphase-promoting complex subunit 10 n=2 Tax=Steinernema glaseri TaxID=37863 RepID=A0A1I8A0T4_9BILA
MSRWDILQHVCPVFIVGAEKRSSGFHGSLKAALGLSVRPSLVAIGIKKMDDSLETVNVETSGVQLEEMSESQLEYSSNMPAVTIQAEVDSSVEQITEAEEEVEEMDDTEGVMVSNAALDSTLLSSMSTAVIPWENALPDDMADVRDITFSGVWSLSSCKIDGYGITQLLDEHVDQYWQSDGPQPHQITVEFQTLTDIVCVLLYLDFKTDESYTPSRVSVQLGSSILDFDEGRIFNFSEPMGWQVLDLRDSSQSQKPAQAFALQLQVMQNHQNGRDTHIRHMKIIGPGRTGLYDPVEGVAAMKEDFLEGYNKAHSRYGMFHDWEWIEKPSSADFGFGLSLR